MKIYKLSLGGDYFDDKNIKILKTENLVSIHPNTPAKGQSSVKQGEIFLKAKKGDIFYVCRSNSTIEFIGMFIDERPLFSIIPQHEEWVDREFVLIADAKSPSEYDKSFDKWWSPKNNSTFTEVAKSDNSLFEEKILLPVFNITLDVIQNKRDTELVKNTFNFEKYIAMQLDFNKLMNNEVVLFQEINSLTNIELKKIEYTYLKRGDISKQPVVFLRSKLLELLLNGTKLDATIINQVKEDIDASFEKKVFQAWSSNFRILYTFLYDKDKSDLETFFKELINQFQKDLEIEKETKIKLVHFDGAQNQGQDRLWFAIYNKVNKSQKLAKQLFFEINNGISYGLLNHGDLSKNEIKKSNVFNYQEILNTFKLFKQEILNDNSMEKAKLAEYIDILKYKKQIILQGPPGTGKTYTAKKIAEQLAGRRSVANYSALTSELIIDSFKVGQKIANASGKLEYYNINNINKDSIELQSERSQPWKPKYKNIISKYNQLVQGENPSNIHQFEPYELAVAKHLFGFIKPNNVTIEPNYTIVQFHPSYSYEDFVRGITVKNENDNIVYKTENKVVAKLCKLASNKNELEDYNISSEYKSFLHKKETEAWLDNSHYYFNAEKTIRLKDVPKLNSEIGNMRYETLSSNGEWHMQTWINIKNNYNLEKWKVKENHNINSFKNAEHYAIWKDFDAFVNKLQNNDYVLIIDEINRANLPSVLGELIYALEYRGDAVNSMYAIDNDATITIPENLYIIGTMNTADRSVGHIDYAIKRRFSFVDILPNVEVITNDKAKELFKKVSELFTEKYLASDFDAKDVQIGHSYFLLNDESDFNESEQLKMKLDYEILPILNEYVKDGLLLETAKEKIKKISGFEC